MVRSGEKGKQWEIALSRFTAQSNLMHATSSSPPHPIHASTIPLVDKFTMLQSQLPLPWWPGGLQGSWHQADGAGEVWVSKHQCPCPMQGEELRQCRLLPYREFLARDPSGQFLLSWDALLIHSWQKKLNYQESCSSTHRLPQVESACPAWSTAQRGK